MTVSIITVNVLLVLVLALLFFFFQSYGPHRDLHSFPTRRSSDLAGTGGNFHLVQADGNLPRLIGPVRESIPQIANRPEDRKSTRLNSSHRTISYAVFCLKKKKNRNTIVRRTIDCKNMQCHEYMTK